MADGSTQINHYDAEGLRVEMEENGQLVKFLFNEEREVVAEETDDEVIRYIRGLGIISSDSESARTYYHYVSDNQGSVRLILTDTVNDRRIRNYYYYDAFGESVISHEDVHNRFWFNGEQYDPVTSQYYLRARFYNPVIGRFTQEDTYYGDGLNLYEYCRNNPVLYRDPSGHDAVNQGNLYRHGKLHSVPSQEQMHNVVVEWSRMEESLANSKTQLNRFNTASVVYDSATGNYYYGMNRGVQLSGDNLNALLKSWLPEKSLNDYKLGNCAEVDAINQALNSGANVNGLYMYTSLQLLNFFKSRQNIVLNYFDQ